MEYTILVSWISPNVQIAVKFSELSDRPGYYRVTVAGEDQGIFHSDFCNIRLASELVNSL